MDLILVSAVVLLLTIFLWKCFQKPANFPPGDLIYIEKIKIELFLFTQVNFSGAGANTKIL